MTLEQDVALLQGVPAFEVLTPEAVRILAISADQQRLARGDTLFKAGDPADCGYVLLSGRLELSTDGPGRRRRLSEVLPGALVGETALIIEVPRPVNARALEPSALMRIPRATFLRMLEGFPEAAADLRDRIASRLETTIADLEALRRARLEAPVRPPVHRR